MAAYRSRGEATDRSEWSGDRRREISGTLGVWNRLLEVTIGYGYRPLRALWWMAGFVAIGTLLFGLGYLTRIVTPTDPAAYRSFVESGTTPSHYPPFNALIYSLENFLPVVALHQEEYWRPNPLHGVRGEPSSASASSYLLGSHEPSMGSV